VRILGHGNSINGWNSLLETAIFGSVPVQKIVLNKTKLKLHTIAKKEETILAVVFPPDATNPQLEWISSNPEVAAVDQNGKVTAVSRGKAVITIRSQSGLSVQCEVTVNGPPDHANPPDHAGPPDHAPVP
jgi:uncharacterized protein YjdB